MSVFDDVKASIRDAMEETGTPGVAVALLHEGEEQAAGFGVTSVENPLDVTPNTLFQIGSITKTFTGTAAMCLVEQGLLDLDAPVRTYLPDLRLGDEDVAARATMRHLLTHTAGWMGDWFDDHGAGDDALARNIDALAELPQLTPLGEVWSYNNAAFYIAGRVIEVLSGTTYEQAVKDLLFDPLGLDNTFFFADEVMTRRFAVGHNRAESGPPTVARPWPIGRANHPAGAIASDVLQLVRWGRFHLSGGEGILTRETLDEMQRDHFAAGSIFEKVGITWDINERSGARLIGHGGTTNGQNARFFFAPDHDFVFAMLTNHQRGGEVIAAARAAALKAIGAEDPARTPIDANSDEHLGNYTSTLFDAEIRRENGKLILELKARGGFPKRDSPPQPSPPPMTVAFYEPDRLVVTDGPPGTAEFLRDANGRIEWFRLGGRTMARTPE